MDKCKELFNKVKLKLTYLRFRRKFKLMPDGNRVKFLKDVYTNGKRYQLPNDTWLNAYSHIMKGAVIGRNSMLGEKCFVHSKVRIGNNTKIQNGNNLWNGLMIGDNVFIGPECCFTNHRDPSERLSKFIPDPTIIDDNATISTNVTVIAPCVIKKGAFIGASSVVLRDIEENERCIDALIKIDNKKIKKKAK